MVRNIYKAALMAALFFFYFSFSVTNVQANTWTPLKTRLIEDGFESAYTNALFSRAEMAFDPLVMARKMNVLLETHLKKKRVVKSQPAKPLSRYLNPILLAGAYAYLREQAESLRKIEKQYGVPDDIIVAVFLVETKLGRTIGDHSAFAILANMALGGDFKRISKHVAIKHLDEEARAWLVLRTRKKGNWAYNELKALLQYAKNAGVDPLTISSSVYGAIGLCQFMPTSALHYGRDGNDDGIVDLFNEADALCSIASYLHQHGWKNNLGLDAQAKVIYAYNHSEHYALTILEVAKRLRNTDKFFGRN